MNTYYLMLSTGQEARSGLAVCLSLEVSHEVLSKSIVGQGISHPITHLVLKDLLPGSLT